MPALRPYFSSSLQVAGQSELNVSSHRQNASRRHSGRTHHIQYARGKSQAAGRRSVPTAKSQASGRAASRSSLRPSRLRPAPWRAGSRAPSPTDRRPVWRRIALGRLAEPGVGQACCRDSGASRIERLLRRAGPSIHSCRARRQPCLRHSRRKTSPNVPRRPKSRADHTQEVTASQEIAPQRTQAKNRCESEC